MPKPTFSKKNVDLHQEEGLLAGMIMSERFLREVQTLYQGNLITTRYVRTVADWCMDYYERYETNPGPEIEALYHKAIRDGMDDPESEAIGRFLESINRKAESGRFDNFNVDHALDEAEQYFRTLKLTALKEDIGASLDDDDVETAELSVSNYVSVTRPESVGVDPFTDEDLIRSAFEDVKQPLYKFPGAYGELINEYLIREGFIGYMAPEKGGKTWELQEHAMRASAQRLNVAFFSMGDMSEKEMAMRMGIYIAKRSNLKKYCKPMWIPVLDCARNQTGSCNLCKRSCEVSLLDSEGNVPELGEEPEGYKPCTKCEGKPGFKGAVWYRFQEAVDPLIWPEAIRYNRWWHDIMMLGRKFRLVGWTSGTHNVADIDNQLEIWCYLEDWVPDVIIVDYADICSPEPGTSHEKERDKQNQRWIAFRALSQKWHSLVITATQTDADSYEQGLLLRKNFSEDKRKYGHSTATIGINQTEAEAEKRIGRRNVIMARQGSFNPYNTVTVLQCLEQGRPCIDSLWTPSK